MLRDYADEFCLSVCSTPPWEAIEALLRMYEESKGTKSLLTSTQFVTLCSPHFAPEAVGKLQVKQ